MVGGTEKPCGSTVGSTFWAKYQQAGRETSPQGGGEQPGGGSKKVGDHYKVKRKYGGVTFRQKALSFRKTNVQSKGRGMGNLKNGCRSIPGIPKTYPILLNAEHAGSWHIEKKNTASQKGALQ